MATYTVTNTVSDNSIRIVGDNYALSPGESVVLEQWQFIPQDLEDITNGIFSVVPALPCDFTGLNLSQLVARRIEIGEVLDKKFLDLRLDVCGLLDLHNSGSIVNSITLGTGLLNSGTAEDVIIDIVWGTTAGTVAMGDHTHATLPTADEKDAMTNAASPNAANPFATIADVVPAVDPFKEFLPITANGQTGFILSFAPLSNLMDLHVNGVKQTFNIDYIISGTALTWLNTDFMLLVGDVVSVSYFK